MLARWIACGRQANRLPNIFSSQCSLSSYGINKNDTPKEIVFHFLPKASPQLFKPNTSYFTDKIDLLVSQIECTNKIPLKLPKISEIPIIDEIYENIGEVSIVDPLEKPVVVEENPENSNSPMYAHRSHIYWRRRRMRRHRLLRWRKKHPELVRERDNKRLKNRKEKHEEDLRRAWEQFGLNSEPPELSEEEAEKYVKEWRNSGRLVDILDRDEMMKYSSIQQIRNLTDQEGIEHARNKRNPKRQPHRHSF